MNNYNHIRSYVNNLVDDSDTRELISDFAILWNLYEKELYQNGHDVWKIRHLLKKYNFSQTNKDSIECLYKRMYNYLLEKRYVDFELKIDIKRLIDGFNIRIINRSVDGKIIKNGDIEFCKLNKLVTSNYYIDKLNLILIIVSRVRNNMFHGLKEVKDIIGNKELFVICNQTLKFMLDMKDNRI